MSPLTVDSSQVRIGPPPGSTFEPLDQRTTLEDARRILAELGSEHDPVFYKGEETTVADLALKTPNRRIHKIRLGYFAGRYTIRRVENGTLAGMIHERGGVAQAEENAKWPIFRCLIDGV
jgi:hypothetical protein